MFKREMLTLCGTEVGTVQNITTLMPNLLEIGQYRRSISNECRMVTDFRCIIGVTNGLLHTKVYHGL